MALLDVLGRIARLLLDIAQKDGRRLLVLHGDRFDATIQNAPWLAHLGDVLYRATLNANGGIAAAEAYAFHEALLAERGDDYDPRVAGRIRAGAGVDADELAAIRAARSALIVEFEAAMAGFDALLSPTVPIVPPAMAEFALDADYVRLNLLLLRNPSLFNFLDGCAISLPVSGPGEAPVGLMLARPAGEDRALLSVAQGIEATISR